MWTVAFCHNDLLAPITIFDEEITIAVKATGPFIGDGEKTEYWTYLYLYCCFHVIFYGNSAFNSIAISRTTHTFVHGGIGDQSVVPAFHEKGVASPK